MQKEKTSPKGLKARAALSLAVLGIVYGDIGTSPLYALRESVLAAGGPSHAHVLGALSLMAWALLLVVTVKYVLVVLRVDNGGEGGILALTALALQSKSRRGRRHRWLLIMGLLGTALFYGDSVITPAISVLSAVEGIEVLAPNFQHFVVPAALVLLIGLFVIQQFGTAKVGMLFGPIIALWFLVLAVLGGLAIADNPAVLWALDPRYGIDLLAAAPGQATAILGAVVLTVTGAEALYADLGHFGRRPIAVIWLRFVFPALLINYFGQGALLLARPETIENPFYLLAPKWSLPFMIALAAAATIIASQAVISGAFSLTQQAVQLGYLPRITVRHTSAETKGQVFVPLVSSVQATLVAFVVMEFGTSGALASAYGIAVTGTMALTAILGMAAWRVKKGGSLGAAIALFGFFLAIDLIFFSANATKVASGGWLPLGLGAVVFLVMRTWIMGRQALLSRRISGAIPLADFLKSSSIAKMNRVAGTAVYMVAEPRYTPTALLHNMKHNKVLHERVVVLAVKVEDVPHVPKNECVKIEQLAERFFMVTARIGFTEEANIPRILVLCRAAGLDFVMEQTSFFIGREKVVVGRVSTLSRWRRRLFILLTRSMTNVTDYFHLPPNRVVELGGQIEL